MKNERKAKLIAIAKEVRAGSQAIREYHDDDSILMTEARELRRNADQLDKITGHSTRHW